MKKMLFLAVLVVIGFAVAYMLMPGAPSLEQACTSSGGTVITSLCCESASDFPNTCAIGACGCSPDNSHDVKSCDCGEGRCWNSEMSQCV